MSENAKDISHDHLAHLMMDYASGALDEGFALVMASYVSLSPAACAQLRQLESIGGALLCQDCEPEDMKEDSLQNVMARLDDYLEQIEKSTAETLEQAHMNVKIDVDCCIPKPITQHIAAQMPAAPKWSRLLPGIEVINIPLSKSCANQLKLIKLDPATTTPAHTHRGLEITLVLDGAFTDETGSYPAGSILAHDEHVHHQPVSCPKQGCVCLIATDAPLRFTQGLMRLLNPFLK